MGMPVNVNDIENDLLIGLFLCPVLHLSVSHLHSTILHAAEKSNRYYYNIASHYLVCFSLSWLFQHMQVLSLLRLELTVQGFRCASDFMIVS